MQNNIEAKSLEQCLEEIEKLNKDLAFAEKGWKDASQANAVMSGKVQKLESALKEKERQIEVWREAYETVVNSKTWKTASRVKHILGKKE
ncbi:MAG: hypothetical protein UHS54_11490 [Lachnospiraceae bacterium]|nr:hypothetical protein [Lachnospiraceae bacterium]